MDQKYIREAASIYDFTLRNSFKQAIIRLKLAKRDRLLNNTDHHIRVSAEIQSKIAVVCCCFNLKPNGICISQRVVTISLIRHSYSSSEVIIHTIFALWMLLLSSQMLQKALVPMP